MSKINKLLVISCLSSLFTWFIFEHLVIVTSNSVEHQIFWKTNTIAEKNQYALFNLSYDLIGLEPVLVTKYIACGPGDFLEKKKDQFMCNGKPLGLVKKVSDKGDNMPIFEFNGVIPERQGFAMGTHQDSFDSRYFGLIDLSETKKLTVIY